jgi:hypothetical protein
VAIDNVGIACSSSGPSGDHSIGITSEVEFVHVKFVIATEPGRTSCRYFGTGGEGGDAPNYRVDGIHNRFEMNEGAPGSSIIARSDRVPYASHQRGGRSDFDRMARVITERKSKTAAIINSKSPTRAALAIATSNNPLDALGRSGRHNKCVEADRVIEIEQCARVIDEYVGARVNRLIAAGIFASDISRDSLLLRAGTLRVGIAVDETNDFGVIAFRAFYTNHKFDTIAGFDADVVAIAVDVGSWHCHSPSANYPIVLVGAKIQIKGLIGRSVAHGFGDAHQKHGVFSGGLRVESLVIDKDRRVMALTS